MLEDVTILEELTLEIESVVDAHRLLVVVVPSSVVLAETWLEEGVSSAELVVAVEVVRENPIVVEIRLVVEAEGSSYAGSVSVGVVVSADVVTADALVVVRVEMISIEGVETRAEVVDTASVTDVVTADEVEAALV